MTASRAIGLIIARLASSRLPGKALRAVNGRPLLSYTLERLQAVSALDEIWLATTQHPSDEQLLLWGIQQDLRVFGYPGEMDDVVGRITAAVRKSQADRFVMVLGDTPFADSRLIEKLLAALDEHPEWDAVGVDDSEKPCVHSGIACFRAEAWFRIDAASQEARHREHPASILQEQPDLIVRGLIQDDPLYYEGPFRLTVDTQADLDLIEQIVCALQRPGEVFTLAQVIEYLKANPELAESNTHVRQKTVEDESLRVLLAVQAGGDYGSGHLARCKTLARVLEEHFSAGVTFWIDGPNPRLRREMADNGYNVIEGNWSLQETIRQGHYNRLAIDFQSPVTPSLIQGIRVTRAELPIIVLDNNGLGCADADAVIFPNAHSQPNPEWHRSDKKLYQGTQYVVLGAGFLYEREDWGIDDPQNEKTMLLVTMGGRDPEQMSEKVLDALSELRDCHIDLVVPPMYLHPENLEKIATRLPSTITLHWRVTNLRHLMQRATLAVSAFGITAYELAYLGVPTLLLAHYQDQQEDMERFAQWGSAKSLGWGKRLDPEKLYQEVCYLIEHPEVRASMAEKGQVLADPKGPLRVADLIATTVREPMASLQE